MNIVIDKGNTLTKVALYEERRMIWFEAFPQLEIKHINWLVNEYQLHHSRNHTIISSVTTDDRLLTDKLLEVGTVTRVEPSTPIPLKVNYKTPTTLGTDRLAAAVGAADRYPGKNILVFQVGSCLTHEWIVGGSEYEGGGISPGLTMRFKALHTFTERLPLLSYREAPSLAGKTTEESILAGVINGMASEIDGTIDRYKEKYTELTVVLTGGDTNYFDKRLKNSIFALPNLVLEGLNIILRFNDNLP